MAKCLVIIDMQKGFINKHTEHLPEKILNYIELKDFDYIIGTKYINNENTACYQFENWHKCMEGTEETEIIDVLKNKIDITFDKSTYSCWNDEFKQFIKDNNINELYFVGVNTACCVLASVFDAYNDLVSCYVVHDLCASTSGTYSHHCGIHVLKECITSQRIIGSEE